MRHHAVRTKAIEFIRAMPDLAKLHPTCPNSIRKVAFRLLHSGIYKTHTMEPIALAAPKLIELAKERTI